MLNEKKISMKEIWKDIDGYNGVYKVSNTGRVYSTVHNRCKKQTLSKRGYYCVDLWKGNKRKNVKVHRLIAIHFISNPEKLPMVNHINGCKTDNKIENLEWIDNKGNIIHAINLGLKKDLGEKHWNNKLTEVDVKDILLNTTDTHQNIAHKFGVCRGTITAIKNRKRWKRVY